MTRYVLDAPLHLVAHEVQVSPRHQLVAPNLIRSQALSLLLEAVRIGKLACAAAPLACCDGETCACGLLLGRPQRPVAGIPCAGSGELPRHAVTNRRVATGFRYLGVGSPDHRRTDEFPGQRRSTVWNIDDPLRVQHQELHTDGLEA